MHQEQLSISITCCLQDNEHMQTAKQGKMILYLQSLKFQKCGSRQLSIRGSNLQKRDITYLYLLGGIK